MPIRILTEQHYWLSKNVKELLTTPYSRVVQIQNTISSSALLDGTKLLCDVSRDGQIVSYSEDGIIWRTVDIREWSSLIRSIMSNIICAVSDQLPSGIQVSDLVGHTVLDNLSKMAPHKQEHNKVWMDLAAGEFKRAMSSPTEGRHELFRHGIYNIEKGVKYIKRDQDIKGLLSGLLAIDSGVTMRAFQFGSMVFDSCDGHDRNVWIDDSRFFLGKPLAKQRNERFAQTLFSFPREMTDTLIVLFYYQQPFISSILDDQNIHDHLYGSHVWALPSKASRKAKPWVWNGVQISRKVRSLTQSLESPIDPALVRQIAQAIFRDKVPVLFEIFHSRENRHLEEGSYQHRQCLESYANIHGLHALADAANIPVDRAAACLIVGDVWNAMHKIETPDPIWQPMVANSYIFPTIAHDELAYLKTQNLKAIYLVQCSHVFDEDALIRGVKLLKDLKFLEDKAGEILFQLVHVSQV
jgi:hypothetical protein